MTVAFRPDLVLPHDPAGFGAWLLGHYLEHQNFISVARGLTPSISIPDYALLSWSDEPSRVVAWLNAHQNVHAALRAPADYSGIDLSVVDLSDDEQWNVWMDEHRTEHAALRAAYGIS